MMVWKTTNQCVDICVPKVVGTYQQKQGQFTLPLWSINALQLHTLGRKKEIHAQSEHTKHEWKLNLLIKVARKLIYVFERWRKLSNRPYQWYRWFTSYCGKGSWSFLIRPSIFHVLFHHDGIRVCPHEFALLVTGKGMNSPPWGRSLPDPWRWILDSLCQTPLKNSESCKSSTSRFSSASATNFSSTENVLFVSIYKMV